MENETTPTELTQLTKAMSERIQTLTEEVHHHITASPRR